MNLSSTTFGYSALAAAAALVVAAIATAPSWADALQSPGAAAQPMQLAQAEEAAEAEANGDQEQQIPEITEEVLQDPEMIALGAEVWQAQCRSCHGRAAYPGKAPRLRPNRYDPEFVYHRVTFGFRGMPGWEDVFSEEERVAVTAYILSRQFSP